MVIKDGAETRKNRLNNLMKLIKKHEGDLAWTRRKVVGTFMLQTGLKTRTINEYIDELIDVGVVANEGDRLHMVR